jgi:L-fucose isomerase-like protein
MNMPNQQNTFALYFGNRGFFPETLISGARTELTAILGKLGYQTLLMDESLTKYGAIEGTEDGLKYAQFLAAHRGRYDGVILCLPNFGDETGAIAALRDCGVPILIHAYPDELNKMGFATRRDAFWNGVVLYREKRWAEAYAQFQNARDPGGIEDRPLQLYLRRIEPLALQLTHTPLEE